jgi:hypothetical protein
MAKDILMAISQKQLEANRRNAIRSTGPKTEQGKAIASRNAVTHGLATSDIVINSPHLKEDAQQYEHLLKSLFEELRPEGVLQQHLVVKIANCLWRYRRVINAETAQISNQLKTTADYNRFYALECAESDEPDDYDDSDDTVDDDTDSSDDSDDTVDDDNPDESKESLNQSENLSAQLIPAGSFRLNLMQYEMRLDKQLARAYKLLYHLQLIDESKRLSTHIAEPKN